MYYIGGKFICKEKPFQLFAPAPQSGKLTKNAALCYDDFGAAPWQAAGPLRQGAASCPLIERKGGCPVITYSDLFQFCLVIIGVCSLFLQARKKK